MRQGFSRRALALAIGAAPFIAVPSVAQPAAAPAAAEIVIDNFAFAPTNLTVAAGTRIVWINRDEEPHTIMSADKAVPFKSPALDTGDRFSFVFNRAGTYKYFCTIHSHMVGLIVVK